MIGEINDMTVQYKIWNVSYTFPVPSDIAGETFTQKYIVIAKNSLHAQKKADKLFEKEQCYLDLKLGEKDVKKNASRVYNKTIPFPKLSLEEDIQNFRIGAKIDKKQNKFTIDFLVTKKSN